MVKIFLIGRYSVGKSSLFNSITKQRNIVLEEKATTRDIIRYEMEWGQKSIRVADSAGLEDVSSVRELDEQQKLMVDEMQKSDVILMVVDGAHGVHPQDEQLVAFLRKVGLYERTILVVNKADKKKNYDENDFYRLGFQDIYPVSAVSNYGVYELLDACVEKGQESPIPEEEPEEFPAIALLGKPNVGKSTLFNSVLGQIRSYVQNEEFTTRDPIQERTIYKGQEYKFIDTAGIRSKWMHEFGPIYLSMKRAEGIVKTADIALLMVDGTEAISREDQKIAQTIQANGKACIILVNKKDQIGDPHEVLWNIRTRLRFLAYSPVVFISAKQGQGMDEMFATIQKTYTSYSTRLTTHEVNKMIRRIIVDNPIQMGERKILYVTQYASKPPRFVFFVNRPKMFTQPYINFFKNKIIETMKLTGTPVVIRIRDRKGENE
ncbi:MAG: ribosome biogenesis GTPase Der [Caldisericia bacterium]|nr:ribosome biogenesis GTPase Der [Caldisericia bacterium]MDD4614185.1 ribosome biogenesis GTPase Der [Caldisericia bacterium]